MNWRSVLLATGNGIAIAFLVLFVLSNTRASVAVALAFCSGAAAGVALLRLASSAPFRSLPASAGKVFLLHALCSVTLSYLVAPRLLLGHSFQLPPGIRGALLHVVLVVAHGLVTTFQAPLLIAGGNLAVFHWYPAPWEVLGLNSLLVSSCLAGLFLWFRRPNGAAA